MPNQNQLIKQILLTVTFIGISLALSPVAHAKAKAKASPKAKAISQTSPTAAQKVAAQLDNATRPTSGKSILFSKPLRRPSNLDPNAAVEVRGQTRTLSMMLVLKNGKDSINFIKVRKDYRAEILGTDF